MTLFISIVALLIYEEVYAYIMNQIELGTHVFHKRVITNIFRASNEITTT